MDVAMSIALFNGELLEAAQLALPLPNRGLAFGDGFFETLIFSGQHLRLATDHAARMQQAAAALYLPLPAPLATPEALAATLAGLAAASASGVARGA
ncbi:MAG: 2-keto-4-methylthiobutyrate aminotransferase, partial [Hymenobacter sp.]